MSRRGAAGYTLVEMLVACAILALLALIAMPRIMVAVDRGKQARVEADLRTIQDALERHYLDYGYYPVKLSDLTARGYLRRTTSFRSPVSGYWYFYAVDDNTGSPRTRARAYILGAPPRDAGTYYALYPGRPLPQGINPNNRLLAWKYYSAGAGLAVFASDDADHPMDPPPSTLETFRLSCRADSTVPCDLRTN